MQPNQTKIQNNSKSQIKQLIDSLLAGLMLVVGILPKSIMSMLIGKLTRIQFPNLIQSYLNRAFIGAFRINYQEASFDLFTAKNLEEIFTRKLKPDQREISDGLCSPCDGTVIQSGEITNDIMIQAKHLCFNARETCGLVEDNNIELSWFHTIYLAPHNYHLVHAPITGQLRSLQHIPGDLWPVNPPMISVVPNLYVRNERLIFEIEGNAGNRVFVVMVGALNVGRMTTPLVPGLVTNSGSVGKNNIFSSSIAIKAGDHLGTFSLGSTVVVVYDDASRKMLEPKEISEGTTIRQGAPLGQK